MMWIILYGIHENMDVSELAFANQRDAQIHAEELINTPEVQEKYGAAYYELRRVYVIR
tara:strand:- start:978 stop:1151 length:174 start_codon:yes stop_codon:yes gene_type:complete